MKSTTSAAGRRAQRRTIRRKNLLLDQRKIDRARKIFNTTTDTDAIHQALDAAADRRSDGRSKACRMPARPWCRAGIGRTGDGRDPQGVFEPEAKPWRVAWVFEGRKDAARRR